MRICETSLSERWVELTNINHKSEELIQRRAKMWIVSKWSREWNNHSKKETCAVYFFCCPVYLWIYFATWSTHGLKRWDVWKASE